MDCLNNLRKQINKIDNEIIKLLNERLKITCKIGEYKKQNNIPIIDTKREKKIFENILTYAKEKSLDKKYIKQLFKLIIENSRKSQENFFSEKNL